MSESRIFELFVPGVARPKGSMRAFKHGDQVVLTSDNTKLKGWAKDIRYHAINEARDRDWQPYGGAVEMELTFMLPKPQRPKSKDYHLTKPDLDKLIRGVLDPLTGVVFVDDARVTRLVAEKFYEGDDHLASECGVRITVRKL